jgi:cytochrome P450
LGWLYFQVGQNPEIQNKIHEELDLVLQGNPVTSETAKELKYLSACIDESLRLHPAAAFIAREAKQDLEYKGYTIQKGTMMVAHLWHLHRNPLYYKNPMKFDPERFLGDKNPGLEYIPFGTGPRVCVVIKKLILNFLGQKNGVN